MWSALTSARRAVRRHRRHIAVFVAASVASSAVYAYWKLKPLYDRIRDEIAMIERMTKELNPDNRQDDQALVNRLNQNLVIADLTLRQWMINMRNSLVSRFDVEGVRASIKRGSSSQEDMEKWNRFKVHGFARTVSALYITCMLNALLKMQLAIVARYVHAESASNNDKSSSSSTSPSPAALTAPSSLGSLVTEECNRAFVAFAAYAQESGLRQIEDIALISVQKELDNWQLGALCSFEDIKVTLNNIRSTIEAEFRQSTHNIDADIKLTSHISPFRSVMFPKHAEIKTALEAQRFAINDVCTRAVTVAPSQGGVSGISSSALCDLTFSRLDAMIAELCSIVDTETFHQALQSSIDTSFDVLVDTVQQAFVDTNANSNVSQSVPFAAVMVRIMKAFDMLLPPKADDDSPLFNTLSEKNELRHLTATIFLPLDERGLTAIETTSIDQSARSAAAITPKSSILIEEIHEHSETVRVDT